MLLPSGRQALYAIKGSDALAHDRRSLQGPRITHSEGEAGHAEVVICKLRRPSLRKRISALRLLLHEQVCDAQRTQALVILVVDQHLMCGECSAQVDGRRRDGQQALTG